MIKQLLFAAAGTLLVGAVAFAQTTGAGTLQLSGTLNPSIALIFHAIPSTGIVFTAGDATGTASAGIGTVSMYGTANGSLLASGFTKAVQSTTGFTLTGTLNIEVDGANLEGTTYTLAAQLTSSDSLTYTVDSAALNSSTGQPVTGGTLNTTDSHTLVIAIPASDTTTAVANTITFTASAS